MKVKVRNEGKCTAFFKLCVKNQDQIYQFVLTKGQEKRLKIHLNDKVSNVALFYGPEITRQICKSLQNTEYTAKDSSFLLGEELQSRKRPMQWTAFFVAGAALVFGE